MISYYLFMLSKGIDLGSNRAVDVVCVDALMQVDVEYFLILLMGCREHVPYHRTPKNLFRCVR